MTNLERARSAERCLDHFIHLTGPDLTMQEAAGDLVGNIGHYCRFNGLDFLSVVRTGIGHWHLEQTDEDSLDALPNVTITINQ
jgi:hypothetical protein